MSAVKVRMAVDDEPFLVTIPNVELLEVGEDWLTSTGKFTFTPEDLASAVAAMDSPDVRTPVLKFGHTDPRFGMADGEFSVGRIENIHLSADEMTLLGDYVGVPLWLAKVMSVAYPRRSIEGEWAGLGRSDPIWEGFFLTGVALLGAYYPACSTLEDLKAFWTGEDPPMYDADTGEIVPLSSVVAAAIATEETVPEGITKKQQRKTTVAAAAQVEDVRRAWYEQSDGYFAWIRAMYVDPPEIIWDNDDGDLFRQDYTIDGDDITFGDSEKVKIQYVPAARVAAGARGQQEAVVVYATKDDAQDGIVPADNDSALEGDVKLSEKALKALGLPADATEEQINAHLEAQAEGGDGGTGGSGTGTTPVEEPVVETPTPAVETPATPAVETPSGVQVPEGMQLVDAAAWAETQRGVKAALATEARLATEEKNKILEGAVRAGKFPRARLGHYSNMYDADPEGAKDIIAKLGAGVVPVEEIGGAGLESDTDTGYPSDWAPSVSASTELKIITA